MMTYLGAIWKCRHFWLSLVRMDLRTRYRRSVLGLGWSLLNPIAMTAILCTVFRHIFKENVQEFAPYLLAGLATWSFFIGSALQGCQSFFQGESYIRQYPLPMAIYPLRIVLGAMFHFLVALAVVILAVCLLREPPSPVVLLYLVPSLLILFVLNWSLAILSGLANVYFQDTQHLLEVAFQALLYMTPIIYRARMLHDSNLSWLLRLNPIVPVLDLIRKPVLDGELPSASTYVMALAFTAVAASAATLGLVRLQKRLIFHM